MFKKFISIAMSFAIMTGLIVPVCAQETVAAQSVSISANSQEENNAKISKDAAKAIAAKFLKDCFNTELDDKKAEIGVTFRKRFGRFYYGSGKESSVWEIRYNYNDINRGHSIDISVDSESGKVISYNKYEYSTRDRETNPIAVITEEEAGKVAKDFVGNVYSELSDKIILDENNINAYSRGSTPQYYFRYVRVANGLLFDSDGIQIIVNGVTGEVSSLQFNWSDDISFPSTDTTLDKEKAKDIFFNEAEMVLNYAHPLSLENINYFTQDSSVELVYNAGFKNGNLLDAKSASMLKYDSGIDTEKKTKDLTPAEKEKFLKKWAPLNTNSEELDESQASKMAETLVEKILSKKYEISSIQFNGNRYNGKTDNKKYWTAQLSTTDEKTSYSGTSGNISFDGKTGQVNNLFIYDRFERYDNTAFTPKLTWDEAYDKAINFIAEYYPDTIKELVTEQQYNKHEYYVNDVKMPEREYSFNFIRQVNGISFPSNSIGVNYDIKTGEISSISFNWDYDMEFPDVQSAMSKEDAKKAYFKYFNPELVYSLVNTSEDTDKPSYVVKLTYRLKSTEGIYSSQIDAFTGEVFSSMSDIVKKYEDFKNSIKGHWGEKELGLFGKQGIIDVGSFKPDQEITRLEAIKILVNARGYNPYNIDRRQNLMFTNVDVNSEDYSYLQMAVQYGFVENTDSEFKGDDKISREDMAQLLVRMFDYDKLAKSRDIFNLTYNDADEISPELYGYVAIGTSLGFLAGDDGNFRPKDNTTMAEFAVTVYKAVNLMRTK